MLKYYLLFLLVMSVIAAILYAADKKKAKRGQWRIKEATLLGFGFFGGAIGALIAMQLHRHKTKHWYFWAVNILGLIWQLAAAVLMIVLGK
jgi:uncharacterized membrane protein YsdA (DUF1294 family)